MTEFLRQCAEKDTLTAEDRKRLIEVADKVQVACEYCDYLRDEVCVNSDSNWCADYPPLDCSCKFGKLKEMEAE